MRTMLRLALAAAVAWAPLALAQTIYSWTDETGTVHFTDNLASVPQGAKVVTTEGAELAVVDTGPAVATAPAAPDAAPARAAPRGVPQERSAVTGEVLDEAYWRGAFRTLNQRIRGLEDEVALDEKQLRQPDGLPIAMQCGAGAWGWVPQPPPPVVTGNVSVEAQPVPGVTLSGTADLGPGRMQPAPRHGPRHLAWGGPCWVNASPELERVRERLDRNKVALARAREDLEELDRQASHHGVPREWRR